MVGGPARRNKSVALFLTANVVLMSCGGGGGTGSTTPRVTAPRVSTTSTSTTTVPTESSAGVTTGTPGGSARWTVDTKSCADPAGAQAPITGQITIGTAAP